jgi:hypothetical protein
MGGVVALTPQQFEAVNGYSNYYWGYGGEDDDFGNRWAWGIDLFQKFLNFYTKICQSAESGLWICSLGLKRGKVCELRHDDKGQRWNKSEGQVNEKWIFLNLIFPLTIYSYFKSYEFSVNKDKFLVKNIDPFLCSTKCMDTLDPYHQISATGRQKWDGLSQLRAIGDQRQQQDEQQQQKTIVEATTIVYDQNLTANANASGTGNANVSGAAVLLSPTMPEYRLLGWVEHRLYTNISVDLLMAQNLRLDGSDPCKGIRELKWPLYYLTFKILVRGMFIFFGGMFIFVGIDLKFFSQKKR